jgi:hypothetical protein
VVECARLEIWFTVIRNVGSNPTLSTTSTPGELAALSGGPSLTQQRRSFRDVKHYKRRKRWLG